MFAEGNCYPPKSWIEEFLSPIDKEPKIHLIPNRTCIKEVHCPDCPYNHRQDCPNQSETFDLLPGEWKTDKKTGSCSDTMKPVELKECHPTIGQKTEQ